MSDPTFPALHVRPARGWVNDPNGLALVDGTYHVFFQHNSRSAVHDAIAWGHASSTDLLRWHQEPLALRPRPGGVDAYGCWTGSVVDDGGVPTAVYSAVADGGGAAQVVLARSDRDLRVWHQEERPVVGVPGDGSVTDVRDPFVFSHGGRRYAVQGAGHRRGGPRILLYGCDDLSAWVELGTLLTGDHPVARAHAPANVWECPSLVPVGQRWLLVVSLWRWTGDTHELSGVRYLLGDLAPEAGSLRFEPTSGGALDDGPAFYAPQLLPVGDRVLMWAWAWELGRDEQQVAEVGWAGVLTFPRELVVAGVHVGWRPARELVGLRREEVRPGDGGRVCARSFEVVAEGPLELLLVDGDQALPVVSVAGAPERPARVLVDGSMVEAFGGPLPVTTRAYPTATSAWAVRVPDGSLVRVWRLGLPVRPPHEDAAGR